MSCSVESIQGFYATDTSHCKRFRATDLPGERWCNDDMASFVDTALQANLRRILEVQAPRAKDGTPSVRAWALQRGLEPRNVQRILAGEQSPSLLLLDQLASACGLQGWQLLVPNLDPQNPPVVHLTAAERDFYTRMRQAVKNLPDL